MINYDASIIDSLFQGVDQYGAQFVAGAYRQLVEKCTPIIYLFASIYLGLTFFRINRGLLDGKELPFLVLRLVCILTVGLHYDWFCLFIYDVFTQGPLFICKVITMHGTDSILTSETINSALDHFLHQGLVETNQLFAMGGWSNITYVIFGVGVLLATLVSVVIAIGLIFLSKMGSVVLLALSPIFIFFALYDSTKGWFDTYIQHLFTYALIPIMTCLVLMIMLSVTDSTIQYMNADKPSMECLIPQKCASLGSGFSLKSLSSSVKEMGSSMGTAANAATGGQLSRAAMTAMGKAALSMMSKGGNATTRSVKNTMARFR